MLHLILLILFLALLPLLLGQGLQTIPELLTGKKARLPEKYLSGSLLFVFAAEGAHLLTLLRKGTLGDAMKIMGICVIALATVSYVLMMVGIVRRTLKKAEAEKAAAADNANMTEMSDPVENTEKKSKIKSGDAGLFAVATALLMLLLAGYLLTGNHLNFTGDMTVETVNALLEDAPLYTINPMTGQPYETGIPSRLTILCLPTLYALLCKAFGLSAMTVVWRVASLFWLVNVLCAVLYLARILFPEEISSDESRQGPAVSRDPSEAEPRDRNASLHRSIFAFLCLFLLFASDRAIGLPGFSLLHMAYGARCIRALVLLPTLAAAFFDRRYLLCCMCILAETCILWTHFGAGLTFLFFLLLIALRLVTDRKKGGAK
ncbi:MAG: hypothetical protein K5891_06420 [Lachnospiraceae bacterium]|nr:hypothetical protein [Lachnospiraceae bacterium]